MQFQSRHTLRIRCHVKMAGYLAAAIAITAAALALGNDGGLGAHGAVLAGELQQVALGSGRRQEQHHCC